MSSVNHASVNNVSVLPMDTYNRQLVSHVHPDNWTNPTPVDCYDLVVIGAGTAGLVVAAGAAGLDGRVGLPNPTQRRRPLVSQPAWVSLKKNKSRLLSELAHVSRKFREAHPKIQSIKSA